MTLFGPPLRFQISGLYTMHFLCRQAKTSIFAGRLVCIPSPDHGNSPGRLNQSYCLARRYKEGRRVWLVLMTLSPVERICFLFPSFTSTMFLRLHKFITSLFVFTFVSRSLLLSSHCGRLDYTHINLPLILSNYQWYVKFWSIIVSDTSFGFFVNSPVLALLW